MALLCVASVASVVQAIGYTAPMTPLPAKRRSELRAQAHKLNPTVIIGDKGLTEEVLAEVDRALKAHELIKVRANTGERDARDVWLETICDRLAAHPVQQIGKIFVIYRQNPKEEKLDSGPKPRVRGGRNDEAGERKRLPRAARPEPRASTGTARRRSRTPSPRPASAPRRRRPTTSR